MARLFVAAATLVALTLGQECTQGDERCSAARVLTTASDVKMVTGLVQSFVFVESTKKQGKRYRKAIMVTDTEARPRDRAKPAGIFARLTVSL